jgi:hypothetical protein
MADTVDTITIFAGRLRRIVRITNASDGTGESAVAKIDKSALTGPDGTEPSKLVVEKIEGNVDGMQVRLFWDHDTDDEIGIFSGGSIDRDYRKGGGLVDPGSTGGTGDILLTTSGHTSGDSYDLTLHLRLKD